jgi:LysM repeat protein
MLFIFKYILYLILIILLIIVLIGLFFGMRNKYDRMYYRYKFGDKSYITYKTPTNKEYSLSEWQSLIKPDTLFNKIVTPGTHDSLCFDWGNSYSLVQQYTAYWAQTQSLTVMQQLLSGVRYFDARVGICEKQFCDPTKIVVFHGDFSTNITYDSIVNDLIDFINRHPTEIIVWRFHIYNNHDKIRQLIKDKHAQLNFIPFTQSYFNLTLSQLRDMRPDKTKAGVILVGQTESSNPTNPVIWPTNKIRDPYDETTAITNKKQFTMSGPNAKYKMSISNIYSNQDLGNDTLTVMQMIGVYVASVKSSLLYSLEHISKDVNKALFTKELPPPPKNGYNVIMIDFLTPKESNAIINFNSPNIFI